MGQVIWTDKAAGHLQSIHEYISKDSLNYADSFIHSLIQATQKLEQFPLIGRKVPEFENSGYNFKEVIYRGYRIIYHIKDQKMTLRFWQ